MDIFDIKDNRILKIINNRIIIKLVDNNGKIIIKLVDTNYFDPNHLPKKCTKFIRMRICL